MINLCLVVNRDVMNPRDVGDIARRVTATDPSILINIVLPSDTARVVEASRWKHRSITVAIGGSARAFVPPRGPVLECKAVPKIDQAARLEAAGIATPRTAKFSFGKRYPAEEWSEFVILKPLPLTMSSRSGLSHLYRSHRVSQLTPDSLPAGHFLHEGPGLIQEFIDTGLHPWKWRVLMFLGEPLYSSITQSKAPRVSLDASDDEIETSIIDAKNPLSKTFDPDSERNRLATDERVLEFARSVHACFPKRTLLGLDVLQREQDGKLYALEINAGGNVWHFSSHREGHRQRLGGKDAMIAQYGAWDAAARALIRHAYAHAA